MLRWKIFLITTLLCDAAFSDPTEHFGSLSETVASFQASEPVKSTPMPEQARRFGAEILEPISPNGFRVWLNPTMSLEALESIELDPGWVKNQPRETGECGPDRSRFLKSPDSDSLLTQEWYGFSWFHVANVVEENLQIDDDGLLRGVTVKKFHEVTFLPGSCLIVLVSPDGDAYFRMGRDGLRVSDEPTIPNLWWLEEYVTQEMLVIEMFDKTLVIRTDNEDSFQGPVPALKNVRSARAGMLNARPAR